MDWYAKQHKKQNRAPYILKICKNTRNPTETKQHKYQNNKTEIYSKPQPTAAKRQAHANLYKLVEQKAQIINNKTTKHK